MTDHYAPGRVARLERRVGICLATRPNVRQYQDIVVAVHKARSEIVHTGDGGRETDIRCPQAAFALCFLEVASRRGSAGLIGPCPIPFANSSAIASHRRKLRLQATPERRSACAATSWSLRSPVKKSFWVPTRPIAFGRVASHRVGKA